MKTLEEVNAATSIKDLEDENYRTCPIVVIRDINKGEIKALYAVIETIGDSVEDKIITEVHADALAIIGATAGVRRHIDSAISNGSIYEDPDGFTDYATIDEKFFRDIRKEYLYIIQKNTGTPAVKNSAQPTSNTMVSLDTRDEIISAIADMKSRGGVKNYSERRWNRTGYLVSIEYDSSKGKYRAVMNDGIHGVAYASFPNDARIQRTVYVVSKATFNGKNYMVSSAEDLSYKATY